MMVNFDDPRGPIPMPIYKGVFSVGFVGFDIFAREAPLCRHGDGKPDLIILNSHGKGILAITEAVALFKRFDCWVYVAPIDESERVFEDMKITTRTAARAGIDIKLLGANPQALIQHHASGGLRYQATMDLAFDAPHNPDTLVDGYRLAVMSEQEPDFGCHYYALPIRLDAGVVPMPGAMPEFWSLGAA